MSILLNLDTDRQIIDFDMNLKFAYGVLFEQMYALNWYSLHGKKNIL